MMDPQERFCHNESCWAYGRAGEEHIVIHSRKERRYKCKRCAKTFSETKGTALYRAHKPHELVVTVVTLLAYGCPIQAIVAAFSLDERTIARWQHESGHQCRRLHEHLVQAGRRVLLAQVVQADELRIRIVGGVLWLASAISVSSRLWLGGVV
jgi:transposase-like protein